MSVQIKATPELVRAAGSHHLEPGSRSGSGEAFGKEELWPTLELEAPRAGRVRAEFTADRYVDSSGRWGSWRIILRDVRTPPAEDGYRGAIAAGIGDATRDAIRRACEPLIRDYLETDAYRVSRARAAARAVVGTLNVPAEWSNTNGRTLLERAGRELEPRTVEVLLAALAALERARELADEATAAE